MKKYKFISKSELDTKLFAKRLASILKPNNVIVLTGELGSGKTKFVEGFLEYLCDKLGEEEVPHLLRGGRKLQSEVKKIEELMKEYKFNASYGKISETLEPYVIALKARYKKFINS